MIVGGLIDLVVGGDEGAARAALAADPSDAARPGPRGVGLVRFALHHHMSALAGDLMDARAPVDAWDLAALGWADGIAQSLDADHGLLERPSSDGFRLLHLTAYFGRVEVTALLLNRGAEAEAVSDNAIAVRPLNSAAAGAHETIVHLLLDRGADPDARMAGGYAPLHAAAHNGHVGIIRLLLERGADPHAVNERGETAIEVAGGATAVAAALET